MKGRLIPVNTPVTVKPWSKGFLLALQDGREIYFEVDERNAKMNGAQYAKMITPYAEAGAKASGSGVETGPEGIEEFTRVQVLIPAEGAAA